MIAHRIRRRIAYADPRVGELARDVDDALLALERQMAELEASAGSGTGGAVSSVFARTGDVVAEGGDYSAALVENDSTVSGATVADALDNLDAAIPAAASELANDSGVAGATVADALDTLDAAMGSSLVLWMPDAPPASAHASDNEFTSSFADFTETDNAGLLALSLVNNKLRLSMSHDASNRRYLVTKPWTGGAEFAFAAKFSVGGPQANFLTVGLCVAEDLITNPTTAGFWEMQSTSFGPGSGANTGIGFFSERFTDWDTFHSISTPQFHNYNASTFYLRCRVPAGLSVGHVNWDWSSDGNTWMYMGQLSIFAAFSHIGIVCSNATGSPAICDVEFFRVKEGSGTSAFDHATIGRQVTLLAA